MTMAEVAWECFRYFVHMDESNAAIHCAPVRYSPITFRLAEHLSPDEVVLSGRNADSLVRVRAELGKYEEDKGR